MKSTLPVVLALLLAACANRVPLEPPDGPPDDQRDVSAIPDAVPREEPRTAAGNSSPYTVLGQTYEVMPESRGYLARGIASWYGRKFHGRRTANGEIYDMWGMTAAHRSLPIPSYLRVTNLRNGRSAVVRVNDRGPFHSERIIDLSYAAAVKLGFADQGTASVELQALEPRPSQAPLQAMPSAAPDSESATVSSAASLPQLWYLQLGAYAQPQGAERERTRLQKLVVPPVKVMRAPDSGMYRVRIGPLVNSGEISQLRQQLGEVLFSQALIVRETATDGWYNLQPAAD